MTAHKHSAIESTLRGRGNNLEPLRCKREQRGKACSNGDRLTAQCRCGATGVWCPDHDWAWSEEHATALLRR